MEFKTEFSKNYRKWFLKDLLRAIETYEMIQDGESITVALSGGKDSSCLLFMLFLLKSYSHLTFKLSAIHIKVSDYNTEVLQRFCKTLEIPYFEEQLRLKQTSIEKNICYTCARLKRGAISHCLNHHQIHKVAYGHHADDVAETLMMNMIQNRKLGSFSPKVGVPESELVIIRPMVYLEESTIQRIHTYFKLPLLSYDCPHAKANIRSVYKKGVSQFNDLFNTRGFAKKLVASLENIDQTNIWGNVSKTPNRRR